MATIIENLNEIVTTKNEFRNILAENGIDAGDVFSDYPNLFRGIVGEGGGSISGDTINSYISSYLSAYNYIDQPSLSSNSYITDVVFNNGTGGFITSIQSSYSSGQHIILYNRGEAITPSVLASLGYITSSDVSAMGYVTSSDLPTIDENIIPKTTDTYTLGDSSHLYGATYTSDLWTSTKNRISNRSDNQINFQLNGSWRYTFHVNNFGPVNDNTRDLGESNVRWRSTYTTNLYTNTAYSTRYNFTYSTWFGSDSDYEFHIAVNGQKMFQGNMYQFYQLANPDSSSLGVINHPWAYTYTKFLIGQNANISNSAYLPVNTYWYDGSTYHWLGDLFN